MALKEQWKDVVGYEGYYQVSNLGRVRSIDRVIRHKRYGPMKLKGRLIQPARRNHQKEYLSVGLHKNNRQKTIQVHVLVARAWIGPCPQGQQVRHGRKGMGNNSLTNLCYGTSQEQYFDKVRDGTDNSRHVCRSDGVEYKTLVEAARDSDCQRTNIGKVCRGERKTAGGYGWEYIGDKE